MVAPIDLSGVSRVVVLTGAGISVASGLRPYRGPGGLWTEQPELAALADVEAAIRDPMSTWRAFAPMRPLAAAAAPNPAHLALARFEAVRPELELTLVTQNIDGLHRRAGSRNVVALHGDVMRSRCSDPGCGLEPFADATVPSSPPDCPRCGQPLRPDVVLFGEPIPVAAHRKTRDALARCELFLAIGTSGTVSPAAEFVRSAEYAGARTGYVNLEPLEPPNPMFHHSWLGRAEELVPALLGLD